jgi:hypothetical protein
VPADCVGTAAAGFDDLEVLVGVPVSDATFHAGEKTNNLKPRDGIVNPLFGTRFQTKLVPVTRHS